MDPLQTVLLIVGIVLMLGSGTLGRRLKFSFLAKPPPERRVESFTPPRANIAWLDVIYAFVMIVGILAKEIWDNINDTNQLNIRVPRLIAALIVSPIIYAAVYSKFTQGELTLLGMAVAFQNGFFWQDVFRTAQEGNPPSNPG